VRVRAVAVCVTRHLGLRGPPPGQPHAYGLCSLDTRSIAGRWPRKRPKASVDDGLALLAHELLDVVEAAAGLARRGRALPAAERLDARPRAGRRAGAAVHVDDAGLDLVEE